MLNWARRLAKENPLRLALFIDALKLIPIIDFLITIPLEYILWKELKGKGTFYINATYDFFGDFVIPVIGDVIPLNTIMVMMRK